MRKTKKKIPFFSNTLHKKLNNVTMTNKNANAQSSIYGGSHQEPNSQLGVVPRLDQRQAIDISNDPNLRSQLEVNLQQEIINMMSHERREELRNMEGQRRQTDAARQETTAARQETTAARQETTAARQETNAARAEGQAQINAVRAEGQAQINAVQARNNELNAENMRLRIELGKKGCCCSIF